MFKEAAGVVYLPDHFQIPAVIQNNRYALVNLGTLDDLSSQFQEFLQWLW